MDGGAWWAAVCGVAKSRTRLSNFTFTFHSHTLEKEMATHSSVLVWRIPGTGSLVGYRLWGRTESDTTERLSSSSKHTVYMISSWYFSVIEWIPNSPRPIVMTMRALLLTTGKVILAGLAYVFQDWYMLQLFISVPYFIFFLFLWYVEFSGLHSLWWLGTETFNKCVLLVTHILMK